MFGYVTGCTAAVDWRSIEESRRGLDDCNAFLDPTVAKDEDKRLRMPVEARLHEGKWHELRGY